MKAAAIILATGQRTCMISDLPKVLHPLAGKPLVVYSIETAQALTDTKPVLVVEPGDEAVREAVGESVTFVERAEGQSALLQARKTLQGQGDPVLVTRADVPLLTVETLGRLVERQSGNPGPVTVLITASQEPAACCCDGAWLWAHVQHLASDASLAALVEATAGLRVETVVTEDGAETLIVETRVHLAEAERALRQRVNERWMLAGVTIVDPATTYIEPGVSIGRDTTVWPNTHLRGQTAIGAHCHIGPSAIVENCRIGDRCRVLASVLEQAVLEDDADIGPFGHLRKGARVCQGAHVGNFGEIKNATLGPGAKMGHFSYLGDAEVGAEANIGAGTITCNYDGVHKHRTVIEEGAFVGSDTMLVAPVRVGKGARTGAGSVVTHDVPDGAVAYGVPARVKGGDKSDGDG